MMFLAVIIFAGVHVRGQPPAQPSDLSHMVRSVPEPSRALLVCLGAAGFLWRRRR